MSLIVVILPLATLYPFPGVSTAFIVLRIPLLLALLSVIAVQIGHFTRINNQEATLTQPLGPRTSSWPPEYVLQDIWGGAETVQYSDHPSDISLSSDPLPSLPSEWDSQTRGCFLHDLVGLEGSTQEEADQL